MNVSQVLHGSIDVNVTVMADIVQRLVSDMNNQQAMQWQTHQNTLAALEPHERAALEHLRSQLTKDDALGKVEGATW